MRYDGLTGIAALLVILGAGCADLSDADLAGLADEVVHHRAAVPQFRPCQPGVALIDRAVITPVGDPTTSLDVELHGRTCGAEFWGFDFVLYDEAGAPLYLRAQAATVDELTIDDDGVFVLRGAATSSCGLFSGPLLEVWMAAQQWEDARASDSTWIELTRR